MPDQTDARNRHGCQPRARWRTRPEDERLRPEMHDSNDVGQEAHLVPAGLCEVICCEKAHGADSEVIRCEGPGAEWRDGRRGSGFYFEGGWGTVDSLEVGGVFVALGGVYDGC